MHMSKRNIIIGVVVLLLACGLCSLAATLTSNGTSTATVQSGQAATSQPPATPTNTPKPKAWHTAHHYAGSANTQTETFHVSGTWRIGWSCQKSNEYGGNFIVELYDSDGSLNDLVANATDNNQGVYNGHGDGDVYLKVETYSENWTVDIQQYQ